MLPLDNVSRPARQFSAVDLPQPDGPSNAMNSPRRTVNVTPLSALTLPKLRLMPSSRSSRKSRPAIAMTKRPFPDAAGRSKAGGTPPAPSAPLPSLLLFLRADLFVPAAEGVDELIGQQRKLLRMRGDLVGVFRPAIFRDD